MGDEKIQELLLQLVQDMSFVKAKLKNLRTGSIVEKRFNSGVKLEKAMVEKVGMQFLYANGDSYNFMNMETYEQIELTKDQLGDDALYLTAISLEDDETYQYDVVAEEVSSMQKILKENKYTLIRIKGSHFVYSNGERTVAINKDLNMMVAKRLIKENELCIM